MRSALLAITSTLVACAAPSTDDSSQALDTIDAASPEIHTLNVTTVGNGIVTMAITPTSEIGTPCGTGCTQLPSDATVTLTAMPPPPGWLFAGWSGDCAGSGPQCQLAMTADHQVTATFIDPIYPLWVNVQAPIQQPVVFSNPPGIQCPPACSGNYPAGTFLTLFPAQVPGWTFVGWSGPCSGSGTCTYFVQSPAAVGAMFAPVYASLQVTIASSSGAPDTVAASANGPGGLYCSATQCTGQFQQGSIVTLAAITAGDTFAGWQAGPCTGSPDPTCTFQLWGPTAATAAFQ